MSFEQKVMAAVVRADMYIEKAMPTVIVILIAVGMLFVSALILTAESEIAYSAEREIYMRRIIYEPEANEIVEHDIAFIDGKEIEVYDPEAEQ